VATLLNHVFPQNLNSNFKKCKFIFYKLDKVKNALANWNFKMNPKASFNVMSNNPISCPSPMPQHKKKINEEKVLTNKNMKIKF